MALSREEIEKLLTPYFPIFRNCIISGFQRHFMVHKDELLRIHERTKSSYVNDQIVENLKQQLSQSPRIMWEYRQGQRRCWFGGQVCLRVKKLDRNFQPRNIPTQASFEFYNQMVEIPAQLELPDMPPPTTLFLGYTVSATKTAITGIYVVCMKDQSTLDWVTPVIDVVIPLPVANQVDTHSGEEQVRRVRAKRRI